MQLARRRTAAPALGHSRFVTGVTRVGEQPVQLLDVALILSRVYPDDPGHLCPVLADVQRGQTAGHWLTAPQPF